MHVLRSLAAPVVAVSLSMGTVPIAAASQPQSSPASPTWADLDEKPEEPEEEESWDDSPGRGAIPDSVWAGFVGREIEVSLADGTTARGRLLTDSGPSVAIQQADQSVRVIEKRQVTGVAPVDSAPAPIPAAAGPSTEPVDEPTSSPSPATDRGSDGAGIGLIVTGSVLLGLGLGASGMLIAGLIGGGRAEEDFKNEGTASGRDDADARGKRNNVLAIAGGVLTPVLIGVGIGLLAGGVKRRKQARFAFTPQLTPSFAGLTAEGRF